jgi:hypothetical protein
MTSFTHVYREAARRLALSLLLIPAAPVLAVDAGCAQWDASGTWTLVQTNDTAVQVTLRQDARGFSGQASFGHYVDDDFFLCSVASCGKDYVGHGGPIVGSVKGNAFEATVYWDDNTVGVYTGEVGPQGLVVGNAYDRNNPSNRAQWHGTRTLACAVTAAAGGQPVPASAPSGPVVALGRVQAIGGGASTTAPAGVCEAAVSARARNSPATASLERQCAALSKPAPEQPAPVIDAAWRDAHAMRGATLAEGDPLATELRNALDEGATRDGFDYGMAVAEGQTLPGPGKDAIASALDADERHGFSLAVRYSLDRNAHFELASTGSAVVQAAPEVASVRDAASQAIGAQPRMAEQAPLYKLGFDIATGLFGDPALGAVGNTQMGPGAKKIRDSLAPGVEQSGFDDATAYHLARHYGQ